MRFRFITFLFIISFFGANAQRSRLTSNTTLSGSFGSSTYYGDMSPYRYPLRGILKSSSFNSAISITRELNERWAQQIDFKFTELKGSDYKYNTHLLKFQSAYLNFLERNLHFRNHIFQISYSFKYYLVENNAIINRRRTDFLPYFLLGFGVGTNNPKAKAPSDDGSGKWRSLRSLNTSGKETNYSPIFSYLPIGLGFNKKINRRWDFKTQIMVNLPFNDYLDDVSGTLFLNRGEFTNPESFIFHNRTKEPFDALTGGNRKELLLLYGVNIDNLDFSGELRGTKSTFLTTYDIYLTTEIGLTYWLDWKIR